MFPLCSNCDPFPFAGQAMPGSSFTEKENPNSSQDHLTSPFLHFSEPYLADDNEFLMTHFLSQRKMFCSTPNQEAEHEIPMKATRRTKRKKKSAGSDENNVEKQVIPGKRTSKKDRHSKIYTAQGPRDRRMRLSLQIARKFFDLQDMLGFDKASKTIEWLFSKSKAAIKELTESIPGVSKPSCSGGGKGLSSTSESEVVSGTKNTDSGGGGSLAINESLVCISREGKNGKSGKAIINSTAKESRDKARARARERTMEKRKFRRIEKSKHCYDYADPNDLEALGSSSPLRNADNFGNCCHEMNSSLKLVEQEGKSGTVHLQEHAMDSMSIIEKFLGLTPAQGSSSNFNYLHNITESNAGNSQQNKAVFTGNWEDTDNAAVQYTYCTMANMKGSTGNLQLQNPSEIYMINLHDRVKKSSSSFNATANAHEQNPSSAFMAATSANEQNPNSILMTNSNIDDSQSHFLENQFSCHHTVANEYCSFY